MANSRADELHDLHEVHVTVDLRGHDLSELAAFARARDYRLLHIVLESGDHASQPMLSWHQLGNVADVLGRSVDTARELESLGMRLARVKIEVDSGSGAAERAQYHEAHFKLELSDDRSAELAELARELGVHMSRNALWRAGSRSQRFLTARAAERHVALRLFDHVEQALRDGDWKVVAVHREAVLHDSNVSLDDGWST